ncbi:hypothetical protein QYF61_016016 [Mycteria americana]|uniref:Reverse transcriptase domain-containing protein n=1 Tax=Mycteria americana TaxID=33587 RepID=A0AAN7NMU7_MYCAM|nr:hypothetical protein QYF61_016016 [Mycteria americana]
MHLCAVIKGTKFSWQLVTSGIPHGSVLGPILFNNFINILKNGTEFASASSQILNWGGGGGRGAVNTLGSKAALQSELDRLELWALWANFASHTSLGKDTPPPPKKRVDLGTKSACVKPPASQKHCLPHPASGFDLERLRAASASSERLSPEPSPPDGDK